MQHPTSNPEPGSPAHPALAGVVVAFEAAHPELGDPVQVMDRCEEVSIEFARACHARQVEATVISGARFG